MPELSQEQYKMTANEVREADAAQHIAGIQAGARLAEMSNDDVAEALREFVTLYGGGLRFGVASFNRGGARVMAVIQDSHTAVRVSDSIDRITDTGRGLIVHVYANRLRVEGRPHWLRDLRDYLFGQWRVLKFDHAPETPMTAADIAVQLRAFVTDERYRDARDDTILRGTLAVMTADEVRTAGGVVALRQAITEARKS